MVGPPQPIDWAPSQFWDGDDGSWSTFPLLIGNPSQDVRVLISTSSSTTLAVSPNGCIPGATVAPDCNTTRAGIFDASSSTTWKLKDEFSLGLEQNLGYANYNGTYGFDSVALGFSNSTTQASLDAQTVVGTGANAFYLGMFGLTDQPTNFSTYDDSHPSYLTTLKSRNLIPSLSWSYTAGARYRSQSAFGSTTFGGFDSSKFVANNVTFPLAKDVSRDLVVNIKSISSVNSTQYSSSLLPKPVSAFIDSTIPYIYLPPESCQLFEENLGLVWDPSLRLYTVDDGLHQSLLANSTNITFSLGSGSSAVDIVLPYASFDLSGRFPFFKKNATTTRYFPLRRATNDTQFTLGRTFLQEAYLITDYERSNFSVSQRRFDDNLQKQLVPILSANTTTLSHHGNWRLGLEIGLPLGAVFFLLLASLFHCCVLRRRHRRPQFQEWRESGTTRLYRQSSTLKELYAEVPIPEMAHHDKLFGYHEAADTGLAELQADKSRRASARQVGGMRSSRSTRRDGGSITETSSEDTYVVSPLDTDSPLGARRRLARSLTTSRTPSRIKTSNFARAPSSSPASSPTPISSRSATMSVDKSLPPTPVSAESPYNSQSPRSACSRNSTSSDRSDGSHLATRPPQTPSRVALPTWRSLPETPRPSESRRIVEQPSMPEMVERTWI